YVQEGHLVHDLNVGGEHQILRSNRPVEPGRHRLALRMELGPLVLSPAGNHGRVVLPTRRAASLWIDDDCVAEGECQLGFTTLISWSGLDIGRDRSSPVSYYEAPFVFTGQLD